MNILVVNGSPRGMKGNTAKLVQRFMDGAESAGAEIELINLHAINIEPCIGCYNCWVKTPGVCVHKDDMPGMLEKLIEADVIVYATPLYTFSVSGLMKNFMDRHIPMLKPFIVKRGDHYIHPVRVDRTGQKIVVISNAGFPEKHHYNGFKEAFKSFKDEDQTLEGMICCTCGHLLSVDAVQDHIQWYLDSVYEAGREIVRTGTISKETQETLDKPLMDPEVFASVANSWWIRQGAPEEMLEETTSSKGDVLPAPMGRDTIKDLISGMAITFNVEEAKDLEAIIQFNVSGEDPGQYYLEVGDGKCTAYEGKHEKPTLRINTPSEVWVDISNGKRNGVTAMLTGKYTVDGNLGLMMRLTKLFPTS